MRATRIAAVLVAGGVILVLLSTFAFRLGLSQLDTFGWKKLLGTVVGVGMAVTGVLILRSMTREPDEDEADRDTPEASEPHAGEAAPDGR